MGQSKLQRKADFCRQLATLVEAGLPVLRSLDNLAGSLSGAEAAAAAAMRDAIAAGDTFSEAAAQRNELFNEHAIALIRAAEATGSLENALRELADFAETLHEFRKKVLTRLAYPIFLFHFAVGVIGLVQALFDKEAGVSGAVGTMLGILVPLYALAIAGIWIFKASNVNAPLRRMLETVLYHCPGIGDVIHNVGLSRFTGALSALYEAGVPMTKALPLAAGATGTSVLRTRLAPAAEALAQGQTIVRALRETKLFDEVALGMLFTGLEAGKVDQALRRLETKHQNAAAVSIDRLSVIIPGIIYGSVVIFVAILLIKIVAAYVNMINNI